MDRREEDVDAPPRPIATALFDLPAEAAVKSDTGLSLSSIFHPFTTSGRIGRRTVPRDGPVDPAPGNSSFRLSVRERRGARIGRELAGGRTSVVQMAKPVLPEIGTSFPSAC